jgi:hypothetical protein
MKGNGTVTEVTQNEINSVWGNANFGSCDKFDVVKYGLLKCASGYYQGHTSKMILMELNLISEDYKPTTRGKFCLWEWFSNGSTI